MADTKEFKELFNQSGIAKRLIIHFPNLSVTLRNEDIVSESMEISESLCSEPELRFGSCEASVFKLRIIGNVIPLIGETFTVSMYVGDIVEPFVLGTYKVTSDKPTADRRFRDIVAHDAMYDIIKADVAAWYNSILPKEDSTITLREFRNSFMEHFGVEQEEITLPNDEMVVERTIDPEVLSGKDVLSAICEINGCFGHIGRSGKMQYVVLEEFVAGLFPSNELFPAEDLFPSGTETISAHYYKECKYEDYTTKRIGKLQIRQEENDIGCIIGNGENCYIVEDNFLVYGKDAAALEAIGQKLFDIISVLWYRPARVTAIGNPCLEVGSGIRIVTQRQIVETYILERTLKGIQALFDTYDANGEETYSDNVNSVQRSILQLKGKTNILSRTVEETKSRIEDVNKGLSSEIKQTADAINLTVEDLANNTASSITELSDQISLRVTAGEVDTMIDIALNEITITAGQINLDGYVSAGGGNFSIDANGNLKIKNSYHTVEIGDSGIEVTASNGNEIIYGSHAVWFRSGGNTVSRIELYNNQLRVVTPGTGGFYVDGYRVLTTNDSISASVSLNSANTTISYTTIGNINIMSANGYQAESGYKYGNIASTGWVQGKIAAINERLEVLEAKVV